MYCEVIILHYINIHTLLTFMCIYCLGTYWMISIRALGVPSFLSSGHHQKYSTTQDSHQNLMCGHMVSVKWVSVLNCWKLNKSSCFYFILQPAKVVLTSCLSHIFQSFCLTDNVLSDHVSLCIFTLHSNFFQFL